MSNQIHAMIAAHIYTVLCAILICFQVSLVLGAPLGHLTQGGFQTGVLSTSGRTMAAVSAVLLAMMALAVQRAARNKLEPRWPLWAVLCITGLTTVANIVTPSFWERALWGPVASVMLVCAILVWWRSSPAK
ncbi:MAG: hypothetical protein ABJO27_03365 [Pseudoruegeria sp.]